MTARRPVAVPHRCLIAVPHRGASSWCPPRVSALDLRAGSNVYGREVSTYRISQLAARTGVPPSTLRFYETAGLLPAERTASGYRVYGEGAVERLAFIGTAKRLGLSLDAIAELLSVWGSGTCSDVRDDLRVRVAGTMADAARRVADLEEYMAALRRTLEHLNALPDRGVPCDAQCGFGREATVAPAGPLPDPPSRPPATGQGRRSYAVPIACTLTADDAAERVAQWRRLLGDAGAEEMPDGRRVTLPADRAAAVAALAAAEQRCCPFFDFRLRFDGPVVHLEVRAPADALALVAELFAPAG